MTTEEKIRNILGVLPYWDYELTNEREVVKEIAALVESEREAVAQDFYAELIKRNNNGETPENGEWLEIEFNVCDQALAAVLGKEGK